MAGRCLCWCFLFVVFGLAIGCSRAAWQAAAQGAAAGAAASAPAQTPTALLVFGGTDHKTFLGCLNCSEYGQSSIQHAYSYGSPYGQTVFNHFSQYGSELSNESACNPYATDPPVIVDSNGKFYGRLTFRRILTGLSARPNMPPNNRFSDHRGKRD